jgi:hypothetical protein
VGPGAFPAWRPRGEIPGGSLAAVTGLVLSIIALHVPRVFVVVSTGFLGYVAGIDDRVRNGPRRTGR